MKKMRMASMVGALLLVTSAVHAGPPATVSAEDQRQILDLISAYSYTYDGKDLEGYLALYTKDCVWELVPHGATAPTVTATNREELRTLAAQRLAMLHLVRQAPGEKPYTLMTGIYSDRFVKVDGSWKIAKRTLLMDQGEMGK